MSASNPPKEDFQKILERLSGHRNISEVFNAFVRLAACCLASGTREKEYLEEAGKWQRPDLELFGKALGALILEMEAHPFEDLLGAYYMDLALSNRGQKLRAEFHTPKHICNLMAKIIIGDESSLPTEGPITVCEPACGSGAMILAFGEACSPENRHRLRVTAIDINRTACDMTFINTTLWGIPTRVFHGNSLTQKFHAAWSNVHWIMPWLGLIPPDMPVDLPPQGEPPSAEEEKLIKSSLTQLQWPF